MTDVERLSHLKSDLHISTDALDVYLAALLAEAAEYIEGEGITLRDSSPGDSGLIVRYAAYLYRSRNGTGGVNAPESDMPRNLRWALNNRLFGEKGGALDDG